MSRARRPPVLDRGGCYVYVCADDGTGARPREGRRQIQVEPGRHLPERGRLARAKEAIDRQICRSCARSQGRLGSSPQTLADALETMTRLDKELSRLYVYASMLADQDTRQSEPQGMQQEMQQLYAEFGAQAAYIEPEILRIGSATIEKFLAGEPRLKPYAFYLRDIVAPRARTR